METATITQETPTGDSSEGAREAHIAAEATPGKETRKNLETVAVEDLHSDKRWQRHVSKRAERMGKNWSHALANVIVVSRRSNGKMVVIDGQHRAAGARVAGVKELIAEVHEGLTPKDEAKLYDALNVSRQTIGALDRFRARIFYKDPAALAIEKAITSRGGKIRASIHEGVRNNDIAAISALERIYTRGGEDLLNWVLDVIKDSFGYLDSDTASLLNLSGLLLFSEKQGEHLDRDHLVDALKREGTGNLRRMGNAHRQLWGGSGSINGYRAMIEVYNKGLVQRRKLQP